MQLTVSRIQLGIGLLICVFLSACGKEGVNNPGDSVLYFKASNVKTDSAARFGGSIAISGDGLTIAIGAPNEKSKATGIDGNQDDTSAVRAGAVYVFGKVTNRWEQLTYVKASNTEGGDVFGASVALNHDGTVLVVGAIGEDSSASGVNGDQSDNSAPGTWNTPANGAVYAFRKSNGLWQQDAYIKAGSSVTGYFGGSLDLSANGTTLVVGAGLETHPFKSSAGAAYVYNYGASGWEAGERLIASNAGTSDFFGGSVAISSNGNIIAIGAPWEDSNARGINGDESNDLASISGAVYVFRKALTGWQQDTYIKAHNAEVYDAFGVSIDLDADGNTLAVGAFGEDSSAQGVNGDALNEDGYDSGAVYLFDYNSVEWQQTAYIKASNTGLGTWTYTENGDQFGSSLALSRGGDLLVVGAPNEQGGTSGIGGNLHDNSAHWSGAAYLYPDQSQ